MPAAVETSRFGRFVDRYPGYLEGAAIDAVRRSELARLDRSGGVYLDHTGGALYAERQVREHARLLLARVLGNPHSANPAAAASTDLVAASRRRVLDHFRADPEEYVAVFTANASQAIKLVGESYPFAPGDRLLLTFDNHNSVNGLREFDRARGAETSYVPVVPPDLRADETALRRELRRVDPGRHHLFAFPAQSNFSGVLHPLEWIELAQASGWDVLLDAAAFVPTHRLDLSRHRPDFVAVSFYKMFGYPTGVGALLARRVALAKLRRPWFAGGTIAVASVQADRHTLAEGEAAFEDGTVDYAGIPALAAGFDLLDELGLDRIEARVRALTGWTLDELGGLRHAGGRPLVRIYGPRGTQARGGTVTFNVFDAAGDFVDHALIERLAAARGISLRTGCFCNPGAGELALGIGPGEIAGCFRRADGHLTYDDFRRCIDGKSTGAVRVSFGWPSSFQDAEAFLAFARGLLDRRVDEP
jgi:selenocysteine lyase/cysteine desulfurase